MHLSKKESKVVILTRLELTDVRVKKILNELGWGDAEFLAIEDIEKPNKLSNQRVNSPLWRSYVIMEYCASFDKALVTMFRGFAYYALQAYPEKVSVLPYRNLISSVKLGVKCKEDRLTEIEMEEYIFRQFQDKLCIYNNKVLEPIWHKLSLSSKISSDRSKSKHEEFFNSAFFVRLPKVITGLPDPKLFNEDVGTTLETEEYLLWVEEGTVPDRIINIAAGRKLILIDEGNDYLSLQTLFIQQYPENKIIVAYDEEIPTVTNANNCIPACRTKKYFSELIRASENGGFINYGDISDYTKKITKARSSTLLSIVITFHNRFEYLDEILTAFNNQSNLSFEIIIIDNGSAEKLCEEHIPNKHLLKFNLSIFNNMNSYPGAARNLGAQLASGKYITFFDDDNIPKEHFVESLLSGIKARNVDILLCFRELFTEKSGDFTSKGITLSAPHITYANCFRNYIGDNVFIMLRKVFLEIKYTDFFQVGREDIEFLNFVKEQGYEIGLIPDALYYYRLDNGDKIGRNHLTHRTRDAIDLDYGAYRKYRRSEKTFAARKFNQLVDNLAQQKMTVIMKPSSIILKTLRRRLRHVPFVKSVYHGLFK